MSQNINLNFWRAVAGDHLVPEPTGQVEEGHGGVAEGRGVHQPGDTARRHGGRGRRRTVRPGRRQAEPDGGGRPGGTGTAEELRRGSHGIRYYISMT